MKTKFKFLSALTVALLLGFSSCSNDDAKDNTDNGEKKSLFFKLDKEAIAKSEGVAVADGTKATLSSGYLYFVNSGGTIIERYQLTTDASSDLPNGKISIAEASAPGVTISGIPGSVTAAHVFGNVPAVDQNGATLTMPTSGSINTVKALTIGIASQVTTASCNLYGTANLVPAPVAPDYTCDVELNPTIARIELSDITVTGDITGFTVDGIFIDNFDKVGSIGGTTGTYSKIENGTDPAKFAVGGAIYPISDRGVTFDDNGGTGYNAVSKVAKPAGSNVWGYNLFAASTLDGGSAVPIIVIRLKNITTTLNSTPGAVFADPQYITIKGFRPAGGGALLTEISAGKVYKVSLTVNAIEPEDLAPVPNVDAINVTVTVNVVAWEAVPLAPEF
ncbi:hypothetical protein [Dysgonomonas termitidis]|uniref:Major fimbrial subunit protein N-terminal domain-containing protein n=1 Tax=Dysgonomonas termitidis TaxID=1516126 RepID=A0ABV9KZL0_9BACT